jgi:hypothetical protein
METGHCMGSGLCHAIRGRRLFIRVIQVLIENLGHGKHVDSVLLEDSAHRFVTSDLAAIGRVLQLVLTNVLPNLLNRLWARKLFKISVKDGNENTKALTVNSPPSREDNAGDRLRGFYGSLLDIKNTPK